MRLGRHAGLCLALRAAHLSGNGPTPSARGYCGQRGELEVGPKAPACANVLIAHVEPGLSMLKSS